MKKTIFWGALIIPMALLLGGLSALAHGPAHGHFQGGMGPRGHHMMYGPHYGGFSWLGFLFFMIVAIAIVVFFVKWLKKKSKAASMEQFIDTSFMRSSKPMMNQNENLLDQWEKNIINKKEND
jgi:uncharacterized membrane protein